MNLLTNAHICYSNRQKLIFGRQVNFNERTKCRKFYCSSISQLARLPKDLKGSDEAINCKAIIDFQDQLSLIVA